MESIKFALIQSGYCVFGVGFTIKKAISDASKWLENPAGEQGGMTIREVEQLVVSRPNYGDFTILSNEHPEFDSYLKNHGGFVKRGSYWYPLG